MARGNNPSSAIAKKIRGAVIIEPFSVPKVLTATAADTAMIPAEPISRPSWLRPMWPAC